MRIHWKRTPRVAMTLSPINAPIAGSALKPIWRVFIAGLLPAIEEVVNREEATA